MTPSSPPVLTSVTSHPPAADVLGADVTQPAPAVAAPASAAGASSPRRPQICVDCLNTFLRHPKSARQIRCPSCQHAYKLNHGRLYNAVYYAQAKLDPAWMAWRRETERERRRNRRMKEGA